MKDSHTSLGIMITCREFTNLEREIKGDAKRYLGEKNLKNFSLSTITSKLRIPHTHVFYSDNLTL